MAETEKPLPAPSKDERRRALEAEQAAAAQRADATEKLEHAIGLAADFAADTGLTKHETAGVLRTIAQRLDDESRGRA